MLCCDLDLTFDLVVITMSFKILSKLFLGFHKLLGGGGSASWRDL